MKKVIVFIALLIFPLNALFSQNNMFKDSICIHYKQLAEDEYENGNYSSAHNYICYALHMYDSLKMHDLQLLATLKHDAGIMALLGANDTNLFISNLNEAIALKKNNNGESEDYYYSMVCYAKGYFFISTIIQFPHNIHYLEQSKKTYERIPKYDTIHNYTDVLNNLAEAYSQIDIKKSINYINQALQIARKNEDADSLILISNLGNYYKFFGDYEKALGCLKKVLEEREKEFGEYSREVRISSVRLASLYALMGDYKKAVYYSERARNIERFLNGEETESYATITMNTGLYYYNNGDTLWGISLLRKAFQHPKSDKERVALNLAGIYSRYNTDSCYYFTKEAWSMSRTRIFNELLGMPEQNRIKYLIEPFTKAYLMLPIHYFMNQRNRANRDFKRLAFECAIYNRAILSGRQNNDNTTTFEDIASMLNDNEVALEIWRNHDSGYTIEDDIADSIVVFIIQHNIDVPKCVVLSSNVFEQAMKDFSQESDNLPLFDGIWEEILDSCALRVGGTIYIAGADEIAQYPIEFIYNYDWDYVGDVFNIIRVSDLDNIQKLRNERPMTSALLYGGLNYNCDNMTTEVNSEIDESRSNVSYLPGTKNEIDSIMNHAHKKNWLDTVSVYTDQSGTEESFRMISGESPSIIHIATHGIAMKGKHAMPDTMDWYEVYTFCLDSSGLLFSCANGNERIGSENDGFLSANEIMQLDLSGTDLVVLSACKTGFWGYSPYGVLSIQNALKKAGVGTIIIALWDVEDMATSYFLTTFYDYLSQGFNKRSAFKKAQQKLREDELLKNTFVWGKFVMID